MNGLESPKNYSDSPDERRKYKRVSPESDIEATIDGAGVVHVIGLGIGGTGMRVITDKPLPPGAFHINLDLKKGIPPLRILGKVAWKDEEDFGYCKRHFSGVEFSMMEAEHMNAIRDYVNKYL